jgi:hypothetical protein
VFKVQRGKEVLYSHARFVAPIIRILCPGFFAEDFKFIHSLGEFADLREANACAAEFQDINATRRSFFRKRLKIRASGFKASRLAYELFSSQR